MAKSNTQTAFPFGDRLILFRYFLNLFGKKSFSALAKKLNDSEYEGYDENHNTYFYLYLDRICTTNKDIVTINRDKLRVYDENICRYVKQIGEKRGGIVLKYFQYISLLFTEMFLERYFFDRDAFIFDLNKYIENVFTETLGTVSFTPYSSENMNKLAFMCATGSGKTLIMHINILQFTHYLRRAQRLNSHLSINKIIVLSPNEGMSIQHLEELKLSSISATLFQKDIGFTTQREDVVIIDMNKLKEEGKVKTISIDSFEQNNLVLVDEAHRGLAGDVWYDYRSRLSAEGGFSFEYSATFKQALKSLNVKNDKALLDEYSKSIVMDYSYKYFYEDGYGKDYRIYNLRDGIDDEQRYLYLTGCLLSFYQQLKLYGSYPKEFAPFEIQKPLLIFVGNRVNATTTTAELTDVEEVLEFIDKFVNRKDKTIERIGAVLNEDTGLIDGRGNELFSQNFQALFSLFGGSPNPKEIYQDILLIIFNCITTSEEPRLHIENLRQIPGEIGLKIGEDSEYFGVISIGDTVTLSKNCDRKGIIAKTDEFVLDSLFQNINNSNSNIKILIGSRKFTEGWNSWRVSTMGLINFAKGEGSQAIQLFGRGVRLRGYNGCLKRSKKIENGITTVPKHIELLETLTIFGIKAQYMEDFKKYLDFEEMPINEEIHEFVLPVLSRYNEVKDKNLRVIKVKAGANFKKQSKRLILDIPDDGFMRYLEQNKIVIDCRSKVQIIESNYSIQIESTTEEHTLEKTYIRHLDYERIFCELQTYKNEKSYFNIIIEKQKLKAILETDGWYSLIIPKIHIKIDSMEKLEAAADYCVIVLKNYIDRFFKYKKEEWEAPLLEYQQLTEADNNFVSEYAITYNDLFSGDSGSEIVENFVNELSAILRIEKGINSYKKSAFKDTLIAFDFRSHLYAPLISLKENGLKIHISPVGINDDEKLFIDLLKTYLLDHETVFEGGNLYLLRNRSKIGMGFFEAGNFFPDYVLWIDTPEIQYVNFIDPKGLMKIMPNNPKIEFHAKIKELETRLQPTSSTKTIVLNSFIMSGTPSTSLKAWWNMSKPQRESKNVLCLDADDCIEVMISKIFAKS